jgi:hypothetical protein
MARRCRFALRTLGGACAGQQWLCDGDEPLARLRRDLVEQPEQNLRYFNRVPRPVELRELRLTPGGRPLFAGVQLYWKLGSVITTELVSVEARAEGEDALTLEVVTRDPGRVATSVQLVTLSYDEGLESYVYDLRTFLTIHSPELFDRPGTDDRSFRFEYCDPWYTDVPAPSVPFPGMWPKRGSPARSRSAGEVGWSWPTSRAMTRRSSSSAIRPTAPRSGSATGGTTST